MIDETEPLKRELMEEKRSDKHIGTINTKLKRISSTYGLRAQESRWNPPTFSMAPELTDPCNYYSIIKPTNNYGPTTEQYMPTYEYGP